MVDSTLPPSAGAAHYATDSVSKLSPTIFPTGALSSLPVETSTHGAPVRRPALKAKLANPFLSKTVPATQFLRYPKLPVELRRKIFRENLPEPTLFHLDRDHCHAWYDLAYELFREENSTDTSATIPPQVEASRVWKLRSFRLSNEVANETGHEFHDPTNEVVNSERSLALLIVCWEFYHEFRSYYPFSLMAETWTNTLSLPPGGKSVQHVRLHFNKYDIPHIGNLGFWSRQYGLSELLIADTWIQSLEVLHVPWSCFKKKNTETIDDLARGLLQVIKAFPSLTEIQSASGWRLESWRVHDGDWTRKDTYGDSRSSQGHEMESKSGDEEDEDEDNDYEKGSGGEEDSYEERDLEGEEGSDTANEVVHEQKDEEGNEGENGDTDEAESDESDSEESFAWMDTDFDAEVMEEIVKTLQALPCIKAGEVKIPEIKVWISENDTSWILSRDMPSQDSYEVDAN